MIYTWRCKRTGEVREVSRRLADSNVPPEEEGDWERVILSAPSVPWQSLRDSGVFMDENGNYPPRKLD